MAVIAVPFNLNEWIFGGREYDLAKEQEASKAFRELGRKTAKRKEKAVFDVLLSGPRGITSPS